jgi:hypothetical protein
MYLFIIIKKKHSSCKGKSTYVICKTKSALGQGTLSH